MSAVCEDPPEGCPNGHRWVVGRRTHMVGWDNLRRPNPCRVYYCSSPGCDGRVWVESVELRPVSTRPARSPGGRTRKWYSQPS